MQTCWFFLFWFWSPLSALKTAQPLSAELLEILIEFWLRNKKQYFLKKIESWKKGGGEWVRDILLSSLLVWPSLPRSLCLCCDGKDRNKPPLQVGVSPRFPSSSCFPSVFLLLLLFFASPYPSVISPQSPVAVSVVSRSQLERERSWWSCSGTRGLNEIAAAQRRLNISLLMEELALKLFVGIFILHLFYLFFFGESDLKVISAHLCFPLMVSERLRWYFYCDVGRSVNDWALVLLTWSMLL